MATFQPEWVEGLLPVEVERVISRVLDVAFRIHRSLGPGFSERIYRDLLAETLRRAGHPVERERSLSVEFEGVRLQNALRADLVVENVVLVELKAVEVLHPVHAAQLVSYLKASGMPAGLLINFNVPLLRDGIRRYVHPRLLNQKDSW